MPIYRFGDNVPTIHPTAFVHPAAVLTGDVIVGSDCVISANACLRGDLGLIRIWDGAVIQDSCTLESFPDRQMVVETNAHIGQGSTLQACRIGRHSSIGRNCVILNNADIADDCIIGALSFVKQGTIVEPGSFLTGNPAKLWRMVSERERKWKAQEIEECHDLARRYRILMEPCTALALEQTNQSGA